MDDPAPRHDPTIFRMTRRIRPLCLLLIAGVFAAIAAPAQAGSRTATHIVQLGDGVSLAEGRVIVAAAHGQVTGAVPLINGLAVRLPAGAQKKLARDHRIAAVTANTSIRPQQESVSTSVSTSVSADATVGSPEPSETTVPPIRADDEAPDTSRLATAYPSSVLAPQTWATATVRGVGVAVIDTGIDGQLPDFADAQGSSRVVASAVTNPDATTAMDTYGHGTHVAGIIAGDGTRRASDDPAAGKYVGIAPRANLIAIKASDDGGGSTILDAIYGLQFAVDHQAEYNIRVVNLSLSSTVAESYRTDPLDAAVESAYFHGILVVAAAGNRGDAGDATSYAPGNDPFALSVGAVDDQGTAQRDDDAYTDWSSVGVTQDGFTKPDIAAPGAHIVSTLARGSVFADLCPTCTVDGNYIRIGGTSMAAPVVSGVAALIFERHPDWTPADVKATLIETARDVSGGGVDEVNAAAALARRSPTPSSDTAVVASEIVDPHTGAIDYVRSSWGRSSWGAVSGSLAAGWARSSWGCVCAPAATGTTESTRSSWGSTAWLARWSY
jgi:serine protease AprX